MLSRDEKIYLAKERREASIEDKRQRDIKNLDKWDDFR